MVHYSNNIVLNEFLNLLGETNVEKIKEEVTAALIDNLIEAINEEYLAWPKDFEEFWNTLFEDCREELKKKYKKQIKKAMEDKILAYIDSLQTKENE